MPFKILFILILSIKIYGMPGYFEPWGQDADLIAHPTVASTPRKSSIFIWMAEKAIRFHQNILSPVDGPRSHFRPSSSAYMLQAMRKYGFIEGYFRGCDRLLRENNDPWVYRTTVIDGQQYKYDPP